MAVVSYNSGPFGDERGLMRNTADQRGGSPVQTSKPSNRGDANARHGQATTRNRDLSPEQRVSSWAISMRKSGAPRRPQPSQPESEVWLHPQPPRQMVLAGDVR